MSCWHSNEIRLARSMGWRNQRLSVFSFYLAFIQHNKVFKTAKAGVAIFDCYFSRAGHERGQPFCPDC